MNQTLAAEVNISLTIEDKHAEIIYWLSL